MNDLKKRGSYKPCDCQTETLVRNKSGGLLLDKSEVHPIISEILCRSIRPGFSTTLTEYIETFRQYCLIHNET